MKAQQRKLMILRHAKSSWNEPDLDDYERPLSKRGRRDAPLMGEWMRKHGWIPDYIVSSPARRAKETALMVCDALAVEADRVVWDEHIYGAELPALLEALGKIPESAERALLVGHNPGLEELIAYLVTEESRAALAFGFMKTATLAVLQIRDPWRRLRAHHAKLELLKRPKELL